MTTAKMKTPSDPDVTDSPAAPLAVGCDAGLGACVEYIKAEIVKAEKDVKFRDDSYKTWRGGTDASWRSIGCLDSKEKRIETAHRHGRIAIKCRRKLEILQAVLARLKAPNVEVSDERLTEAAERIRCTAGLADFLSYIKNQSDQFRQCAGHHAEHNRGAEAVAIRAAEILDRISADIKSANVCISDGSGGQT